MKDRHYYIYKGLYPYARNPDYADVFWKAEGIIIKCYTEEEVAKWLENSGEVWERVG